MTELAYSLLCGEFRTERLLIRRVRSADWRGIREIWADFDASEYRYFDLPRDLREEAVAERIDIWAEYSHSIEHMFFSVCLDGRVIGYFSFNINGDCYETGYCFHREFSGKGYATEAFREITARMRSAGASRIVAGTALDNHPSVAILERNGFSLYATQTLAFHTDDNKEPVYFEGGWFEKYL